MESISLEEKLRIQFRKAINKGFVTNAVLDPAPTAAIESALIANEIAIVLVQATTGKQYLFTSTRLLELSQFDLSEVIPYGEIRKVHWISGDRKTMIFYMTSGEWPLIKQKNFDRLESETRDNKMLVVEGLDQAYWPTLNFFQWVSAKGTEGELLS